MSDASPPPFSFAQFVPGFDFLRNLAAGGASAASAMPGLGGMSSWVAPTLSVEEIDKRIQELKAVQYWLEQNGHALKATIQALEVQRMTLSTLRGMNVRMEDLAQAFADSTTRAAEAVREATVAATAAPTSRDEAGAPEPAPEPAAESPAADQADAPAAAAPGVIDPLQWWGSLTQQFQQIASQALKDASAMQMPMAAAGAMPEAPAAAAKSAGRKAAAKKAGSRKAAARKKPAASKSSAGKKPAATASTAATTRRTGGNRSTG
ncbi:PhaM family polyhydroxyalkanoate granule multifunctional regulatory protein [uncultured Pseudacidovorax sp.]|uniref:PhaM family polyhydroxyalkanoate granule multifunctional regulatory protein n=1 Tax=uncultured Pseudacidovorax sp. TaxID=679313 RepID=UPI0025D509D8|nr:PhaM family polyhydroxyalkanoate granule multifunctional regulatory protein [uncultured Pseudacidovorax sp.]